MSDAADDLEELLSAVHKTISDNKRFLEKLVDETVEEETDEEETAKTGEDDFEEL
jgi:hypothetical protein